MAAQKNRRKPPAFPGCPRWMPVAVFSVVVTVVIYLLNKGYTVESATLLVISVTTIACEVTRRLCGLPGHRQRGESF